LIIIILPAYNEEVSLPALFPKIIKEMSNLEENYKLIVCNDGSSDNTQKILEKYSKKLPIKIIHHKINRGLGESSRDLFEMAAYMASDNDVVIRLDCDNTHEPKYIPLIVKKVRSGVDVVIASRFTSGGGQVGVNNYRAFISRCANLFMKIFFPIPGVMEYSCGFRGYNAKKLKQAIKFFGNNFIQLKGLGFTCTLEKLLKLKLIGASFGEIPFTLRYDQKESSSKMLSSVTTLGYIVMTFLYYWPWGGWRVSVGKKFKKIGLC